VTLQAAGGFAAHLFPTGKGNVIGKPIEPVIESPANPRTARAMPQHIDVDVSGLLRREMTIDEAGERLITLTLRLCNGRMTWPRR
jgi:(2R)-sulfolactate sulfo-lyase subunit beta